jgi:hypothetical protein
LEQTWKLLADSGLASVSEMRLRGMPGSDKERLQATPGESEGVRVTIMKRGISRRTFAQLVHTVVGRSFSGFLLPVGDSNRAL